MSPEEMLEYCAELGVDASLTFDAPRDEYIVRMRKGDHGAEVRISGLLAFSIAGGLPIRINLRKTAEKLIEEDAATKGGW